jgi:hypothetical protein
MDGGDVGAVLVIDAGADSPHADSAGVAEVPRNHRANDSACATPASPGQCGPVVTNPPDASTSNPCTSDLPGVHLVEREQPLGVRGARGLRVARMGRGSKRGTSCGQGLETAEAS